MVFGFPKELSNQLGVTQGRLGLWYSTASGDTNYAILYDMASGSHQMTVTIRRADLGYSGSDSGVYRCIYVSGALTMGSHSSSQFRGNWGPVACS